MTSDLLQEIGEALYGPHWQAIMARSLEITERAIRRWLAQINPVPQGVQDELGRRLQERAEQIADLRVKLAAHVHVDAG
jgi:hypothetical protein